MIRQLQLLFTLIAINVFMVPDDDDADAVADSAWFAF